MNILKFNAQCIVTCIQPQDDKVEHASDGVIGRASAHKTGCFDSTFGAVNTSGP